MNEIGNLKEELSVLGRVLEQEPMSRHTSYQIGGKADYYVEPDSVDNLVKILGILSKNQVPCMILGKGSNVLFSDKPYKGAVISLNKACRNYSFGHDDTLYAEAGCSLIALSLEAEKRSLKGLEFASGIPGSIGGGLYMNAGAYKADLAGILIEVLVYKDGIASWISKDQLDYTYRHSSFQSHKDWIILAGRFQLSKGIYEEIRDLRNNRKERRMAAQPLDKPTAGSVFRNPEGIGAWQIIDQLGFRGLVVGGAKVSEKHANFIVNENGTASAKDVDTLIRSIQKAAKEKFGIDLITEVERVNWNEED